MYNDSSDDQDDSNAEEGERGRKRARSFDRLSPDSDKAGAEAEKDRTALRSLTAGLARERKEVEQGAVADVEDFEHRRISPVTRGAAAILDPDQSRSQRLTHSPEKDDPRSKRAQVEQQTPQDLERSPGRPELDLTTQLQPLPPHIQTQLMDIENQIKANYPEMKQQQAYGQAIHIMYERLMQSQVARNNVAQNSMDPDAGSTRQQPSMVGGIPGGVSPRQYAQISQQLYQQQQAAKKSLQEDSDREKKMETTGIFYDKRLDMTSESSSGSSKPPQTTSKTSEPNQVYQNEKSTLPHQHDLDGPTSFLTADNLRRMSETPSKSSSIEAVSRHGCSDIARNSMDPDDMTIFVKGMGSLTIGNAKLDIRDGVEIAIRTSGSSRDLQQDKDSVSSPKANP